MTEMAELNLLDLRKRFLLGTEAKTAAKILQNVRNGKNEINLRKLLRHHDEKSVWKTDEIDLRDSFDALLAFYGLVEIACIVGYVPNPLPVEFQNVARFDLSQEAVLKFYSVNYPWLLPDLFLKRLEFKLLVSEPDSDALDDASRIFFQFLGLEERFRKEDDFELLLRLLDSFVIDGCTISKVVNAVRRPKKFMRRMTKKPKQREVLDDALQGFVRLLNFCWELDALLQSASNFPLFQSAMWHYHSYWFKIIRKEFTKNMRGGVLAFSKWKPPESSEEGKKEIREYVKATVQIINRLTSDYYGNPLLKLSSQPKEPHSVYASF